MSPAEEEFDIAWKASLDGAKMVTFDNPPNISPRPGTDCTAAPRLDKDAVAPMRSVSDMLEVELVMFCAEARAAKAAIEKRLEYILMLRI